MDLEKTENNNRMKPLDETPEQFYNQTDSAYLRIQYVPEVKGFKFTVRNESYHSLSDASQVDEGLAALSTLIRGLAEVGLNNTGDVYQIGLQAQREDYMLLNTEEIENEEHRDMMLGEPKGVA